MQYTIGNPIKNSPSRVLVVDDDWLNQDLLEGILSTVGYPTLQAQNAEKAIMLAQNEHPDLIILDVRLPKVNGFEICIQLKSNPKTAHIPIIMITGHKTDEDEIKAQDARADLFIERTVNTDKLLDYIHNILNQ